MRFKNILFITLAIIVFACPVFAANLCVSPSGGGAKDGSNWSNCLDWSTMSFVRGNSYYLIDGDYTYKTLNTALDDTKVITIKKATGTNYTDVTDTTGWVSTMGDGVATIAYNPGDHSAGNVLYIRTSYWEIEGVTGSGTTGHGIKLTTDSGPAACVMIDYNGAGTPIPSNIHLHHLECQGAGSAANKYASNSHSLLAIGPNYASASAYSSGGHEWTYLYVHDSAVGWGWAFNPGTVLIANSYFSSSTAYQLDPGRVTSFSGNDQCGSTPGYTKGGTAMACCTGLEQGDYCNSSHQGSGITFYRASGWTVRNNVFKDGVGSCGLCLYAGIGATDHADTDNVTVHNNLFYYSQAIRDDTALSNTRVLDTASVYNRDSTKNRNYTTNGIVGSDGHGHAYKFTNIKIYNNTFANQNSWRISQLDTTDTTGNEFKNNIIYGCLGYTSPTDIHGFAAVSNNWWYGNKKYDSITTSIDANLVAADTNGQAGTASPFVNEFSNLALEGGCSGAGSPINNGVDLGATYKTGLNGVEQSGTWDMGAYPYQSETPPTYTVTVSKTGNGCTLNRSGDYTISDGSTLGNIVLTLDNGWKATGAGFGGTCPQTGTGTIADPVICTPTGNSTVTYGCEEIRLFN